MVWTSSTHEVFDYYEILVGIVSRTFGTQSIYN
jgi:hypothetical protein